MTAVAFCAAHAVVCAQPTDSLSDDAPPTHETPADDASRQSSATQESLPSAEHEESLPRPQQDASGGAEASVTLDVELPPAVPPDAASPVPPAGIGNADVQAMVEADFSDSTIIAVINANAVEFDLSPRALVALKTGGVSEAIIEVMIATESADERPVGPEPTSAELAETQASLEYARLTQMIEQLAAKQEEAEKARRAPEAPASRADPAPRVWLIQQTERVAVAPTIAQVAFAGGSRRGERFKSLQPIAGQALAFVNPAVSGIATTLGGLFRPDEERTAVWALAATSSSRVFDFDPVFEIDFAHIPGVDPDRYQPAIVSLVATKDNYRLVAAAETDGSNTGSLPRGPIIEENVATESTRLGRGQYRVAPKSMLGAGEYALVLRPIPESARARRRNAEASLGELLGGSTSQILYLTWEFSIAR